MCYWEAVMLSSEPSALSVAGAAALDVAANARRARHRSTHNQTSTTQPLPITFGVRLLLLLLQLLRLVS
jgi:hypothetical protein